MPSIDLIIRSGTVVTAGGRSRADIAIDGGRIVEIAPDISAVGREQIDASGLHVLPGVIDIHLHFNEPGHTDWEGAASGSRALAAGGGTFFADMPLNSIPCTLNAKEVDRKRRALEAASVTDFGLWGGLTPGSVPQMSEMAAAGVIGFKAFMCDSGLPEFPRADDRTLFDGMREAAKLKLPVAVHAESDEITRELAAAIDGSTASDFLASRPVAAEIEAVTHVLGIAKATGARLHLVHVSSGSAAVLAAEARDSGVDVTIETCPHYLFFTEEDLEHLGVAAKCAPPLRPEGEHGMLWQQVLDGVIDMIASDHSPVEPSKKIDGDFRASWGGIAGVQSTLGVLLDRGFDGRRLRFEQIASLVAANPAARFNLAGKGSLVVGNDADLLLLDPVETYELDAAQLQQRHKISPYLGMTFGGIVRRTVRRGETIFADGNVVAKTMGKFVKPEMRGGL